MSTPDMSCDRASRLFDDYLEYRLGKRDRQRLETHVARCPRCARELRARPALDHQLRLALGASVQSLCLSPDANARIIRAAQGSVRRGIWLNRAMVAGRLLAGAASVILLVASLAYLLNRAVLPWSRPDRPGWTEEPVSLSQSPQAAIALDAVLEPRGLNPGELFPARPAGTGPGEPGRPLTYALLLDPGLLRTGDPFTTTLLVRNDQEQSLSVSQVNLDITGPQRSYHFELTVSEPLPGDRVSALRITPGSLAEASRERYQVSPSDIIGGPGAYTIRVTLFHAATVPDR